MDPIASLVDFQGVPGLIHGPIGVLGYRPDLDADYTPAPDSPPGGQSIKGLWESPSVQDGIATGTFVVTLRDFKAVGEPNVTRVTVGGVDYTVTKANPRFWDGAQNGVEFQLQAS